MITYQQNEYVLLQPLEALDCTSGLLLQRQVEAIDPSCHSTWIIDLTLIEFMDSAGLFALIFSLNLADKHCCRLVLHNPSQAVKLVLEIARLDRVFEVTHSDSENHEAIVAQLSRRAFDELAAA
jgi:anti-anti-sigma factor